MFRRNLSTLIAVYSSLIAVAILAVAGASCGGGSQSNSMSQAQAQAVSSEVVQSVEQALTAKFSTAGAGSSGNSRMAEAFRGSIRPEGPTSCLTGSTIDCVINTTVTCPQSGTAAVTGAITGTLNNGSGSIDAAITVVPAACQVDGLAISGNPSVAFASDFNVTNDNLDFPVTATTIGGLTYGPSPSGSCSLNVTVTINSLSSCSYSGNVCGQMVNGSC